MTDCPFRNDTSRGSGEEKRTSNRVLKAENTLSRLRKNIFELMQRCSPDGDTVLTTKLDLRTTMWCYYEAIVCGIGPTV